MSVEPKVIGKENVGMIKVTAPVMSFVSLDIGTGELPIYEEAVEENGKGKNVEGEKWVSEHMV